MLAAAFQLVKLALDDAVTVHRVDIEAVAGCLVVEGKLVDAPAIIGGRVASDLLRAVDVAQTGQIDPRRVDGGGQHHNILPRKKRAAVVSLGPGHSVVRGQDSGDALVASARKAHDRVIDKRRCIEVFGLLIHAGAECAQTALIKAGNRHNLHPATIIAAQSV